MLWKRELFFYGNFPAVFLPGTWTKLMHDVETELCCLLLLILHIFINTELALKVSAVIKMHFEMFTARKQSE